MVSGIPDVTEAISRIQIVRRGEKLAGENPFW